MIEKLVNTDWSFASRNIDDDFHTDIVFIETSLNDIKEVINVNYSKSLVIYAGFEGAFYYSSKEEKIICGRILEKLILKPEWGNWINKRIVQESCKLENTWREIENITNFKLLTDRDVLYLYNSQYINHRGLYKYAWLPEIVQGKEYGIESYLRALISNHKLKDFIYDSNSDTTFKKQEKVILDLALKVSEDPHLKAVFLGKHKYIRPLLPSYMTKRINSLVLKYGYLNYHGFSDRKLSDFNYYLMRIKELIEEPDVLFKLSSIINKQKEQKYVDYYKFIPEETRQLFKIYSNFGITKNRRRLAQLKNFFFLDKLIAEIALRKNLPEAYMRFMKPQEVVQLIAKNEIPNNIQKRIEGMAYAFINGEESIITEKKIIQKIIDKLESFEERQIKGNIVCCGYVVGYACKIERREDYDNIDFKGKKILVSIEADPDLFDLIMKMDAIVTDQGGITCHIASIAREFNIPCIIGTKIATKQINHGDLIIVDANIGTIKIIQSCNGME
jgi:phosphohistidine swiveling domain-containing protein